MKKLIISILLFFTGFSFLQAEDRLGLRGLTIDYLQPQNGMSSVVTDEKHPRFSWQLVDSLSSGVVQTAYRIVVSDEKDRVVWDSGKKTSPVNYGVEYAGSPLTRCTRYRWTLTVWDNRHRQSSASSQFETALMVSSDKDAAWGGAQWIGPSSDRGLSFYSQYLPVFRIEGTVALDRRSRSTRAGLVYGANDERLMNANRNLLNRSNRRGEGYILVELNTTGLDSGDSATLCIYRVGYKADDSADRPFATIKVSTTLVNASNRYASHKLSVASVCGTTTLELDGQQVGKELYLNPMGHGGDYIAFPMVADVGYRVPEGQRANCGEVVVRNYRLPR
ncbi:MAG: alpha-L-rhamnosidase, partial [Prevotella sp.]